MPIYIGTTEVVAIYKGTVDVTDVYRETTLKFTNATQTTTPSIPSGDHKTRPTERIRWTVTNNDALSAEIFSELEADNPTTSQGTLASGATTSTIEQQTIGGATIYAKALASGKSLSEYTSLYVA